MASAPTQTAPTQPAQQAATSAPTSIFGGTGTPVGGTLNLSATAKPFGEATTATKPSAPFSATVPSSSEQKDGPSAPKASSTIFANLSAASGSTTGLSLTSQPKEGEKKDSSTTAPLSSTNLFAALSKPPTSTAAPPSGLFQPVSSDKKDEAALATSSDAQAKPALSLGLNLGQKPAGSSLFPGATRVSTTPETGKEEEKKDEANAAPVKATQPTPATGGTSLPVFGAKPAEAAKPLSFGIQTAAKTSEKAATPGDSTTPEPKKAPPQPKPSLSVDTAKQTTTVDTSSQPSATAAAPIQQPQVDPLQEERIESVIKKWFAEVNRSEEDFKRQASELLEYDRFLEAAMEQCQVIESSQVQIKNVYTANKTKMKNIMIDQDDLLSELAAIEIELDAVLQSELGGETLAYSKAESLLDFYKDPVKLTSSDMGGSAQNFYEKRVIRQQVFQKAFTIEQYAEEITHELAGVNQAIERTQKEVSKKEEVVLKLPDGKSVVIDDILNEQYETLQWLQNAALDLDYKTEDVARKLIETKQRLCL